MEKKPKATGQTGKASGKPVVFMFDRENYKWMFISIAVIILGFILMAGKEDIYSFRILVISPIVVLSGFGIGIYAIMKKPTGEEK